DSMMAACSSSDEKGLFIQKSLENLSSDCNKLLNNGAKSWDAKKLLLQCNSHCTEGLSPNVPQYSKLRLFTKAMLDFTYYSESDLSATEFPENSSEDKVKEVLKQLERPVEICLQLFPEVKPIDILGEELIECIYWRQGALLYMYCCTVSNDVPRRSRMQETFDQNLLQGIQYLSKMKEVRKKENEDYQCSSPHTLHMIKKGVYSDTHLLSFMYKGELSYWYLQGRRPQTTQGDTGFLDIMAAEGKADLETYVEVVEGPLKNQGWTSNRARDLLSSPIFTG
ncbi:UPF0600 protein C5orf51 homolog isoform X1, partial [Argonauta hians]